MRVTTAFKRLLRLAGASVIDVSFTSDGVVVTVRLRRRRRVCSACGQTGRLEIHDRRVKRWRHLDLAGSRCWIECELRLLRCRDCGVRLEAVPWARPGASHTRDFEDTVAWLAQQMAFSPITRLLRVGWRTVGRIVERVVADHLDERRLEGLVAIGVDEISYRRHHRYLTSVADHRTGAIVWCSPGRNSATLQAFFDELGDRRESIRAVSIDMSGEYQRAIRTAVPQAEICFDPFHVVRLGARATEPAVLDLDFGERRELVDALVVGAAYARSGRTAVATLVPWQVPLTPARISAEGCDASAPLRDGSGRRLSLWLPLLVEAVAESRGRCSWRPA